VNLEELLVEIGAELEVPSAPDLVASVHSRIVGTRPARRLLWRPLVWTRRAAALATAMVFVAAGIAVGSYLGVRGVHISTGSPPTLSPGVGTALDLGARTTLAGARARVRFPVRVPAALGAPDEVYVDRRTPGSVVTLLYRPRPDLPEGLATKAGLLLFEFEGTFDRATMEKFADPSQIRNVSVGGFAGFWVTGVHQIAFRNAAGEFQPETLRLSDSALLWQVGAVTLRLETNLPLDRSLQIASSVR